MFMLASEGIIFTEFFVSCWILWLVGYEKRNKNFIKLSKNVETKHYFLNKIPLNGYSADVHLLHFHADLKRKDLQYKAI